MDPLSLTASTVAIGTLAAQICHQFAELRKVYKALPGRLHALNNEVVDIEIVLQQVASVLEDRTKSALAADRLEDLPRLLEQGETKLKSLHNAIRRVLSAGGHFKDLSRTFAWRKEQEELQKLQEEIQAVKCNLNVILGASNSQDLVRIRLNLQSLSIVTSQSVQDQVFYKQQVIDTINQAQDSMQNSMDSRLNRVEEMIKGQADRFEASRTQQLGILYKSPLAYRRRYNSSSSVNSQNATVSEGISVRVTQTGDACSRGCPCSCHTKVKKATPKLVDRVVGQLFVGYSGLPYLNQKCDTESCKKAQTSQVSAEYWFPLGFFWSQIIRFQIGYSPNFGPQFQLSTLRQVPDSAECVNFAIDGNIEGLKLLFQRGLASPRDVSSTRGYSILRWALYAKQWETCRFLVWEGADVDYRPIAAHDNSPRNKAYDQILQGGHSSEAVDALTCITHGSDYVEEQNFTLLHKIVLGLSLHKLEDEILTHQDEVNALDAMNRTPLTWASARGDSHAVNILLGYGADPNVLDIEFSGPVTYSALRNHPICTRLLLESGANPDPVIPGGRKIGSPLNCASRNATDPLILKNLLDFGADIEASGVDGKTPLLHVARTGNADFAFLLLEYGANINAICTAGQTPLVAAITYHSHDVLQLLVDRWYEYSSCPRLSGPNLLECIAKYADYETIAILTATDHFKLKYDKHYDINSYIHHVHDRAGSSEKLLTAFTNFLEVVNAIPDSKTGTEVLLEAGYAPGIPGLEPRKYRDEKVDEESSETSSLFEDALGTI